MIEITNLSKRYVQDKHSITVLEGLNLKVGEGETLSVMGPSGIGKTTLLNIIAGLDTDVDGDVVVDGRRLRELTLRQLSSYRNRTIGFIFQEFILLPHLNALENALLPLMFSDIPHREAREQAQAALKSVDLDGMSDRYPSELSGGQKQRVAIARALINRPKIILADEPTANLDEETERGILDLILKLTEEEKTTLIIATHKHDLAAAARRIVTLKELQGQ